MSQASAPAAPVGDEFSVLEVETVQELSESQQIAALSRDLGLKDLGINGFGDDDAPARAETGPAEHAAQPGLIQNEVTRQFTERGVREANMGVQFKAGAKPLGNQGTTQAIQAQGVVFGPGGLQATNVVPLVVRGDYKPEDRPKSQVRTLADKKQAAAAAVGNLGRAELGGGVRLDGPPTTREELEAYKDRLDREFDLAEKQRQADFQARQEEAARDKFAGGYDKHPGENKTEAAFTITQGQLNTIQRILDTPIPNAQALVAAIATKASVEVAGGEGLAITFTSAELAEIDRRASFWGMTRAQAIDKMIEQVKPGLFDGSSMV